MGKHYLGLVHIECVFAVKKVRRRALERKKKAQGLEINFYNAVSCARRAAKDVKSTVKYVCLAGVNIEKQWKSSVLEWEKAFCVNGPFLPVFSFRFTTMATSHTRQGRIRARAQTNGFNSATFKTIS